MTNLVFYGPTFTLSVPTDWLNLATPQLQALFLAPAEGDGSVRPNLAISLKPIGEAATAAQIAEVIVQAQQTGYAQYVLEAQAPVVVSGQPGMEVRCAWQTETGERVAQTQRILRWGDLVYSLTTTRPAAASPELTQTLQAMLDSFALKPN